MADILRDVGQHPGSPYSVDGAGHYEATVENDGSVTITTVFKKSGDRPVVTLSCEQWDRLVAWIEWQRKK